MTGRIATAGYHSRSWAEVNIGAGAIIGLIGAVVSGFFAVASGGLLLVPGLALLLIDASKEAPGLAILAGLLLHLGFGAIFGVVFGFVYTLLTSRYTLATGIILGILYGGALWLVNFALIGQALNLGVVSIPGAIAVSSHLIFGLVVGFYPVLAAGSE